MNLIYGSQSPPVNSPLQIVHKGEHESCNLLGGPLVSNIDIPYRTAAIMLRLLRQRLVPNRGMATSSDIYFGTRTLNRHSFLRTDPTFIAQALTSPYAKLIFFDRLRPLVDVSKNKLLSLDYSTVGSQNREIIDSWIKGNADRDPSLLQSPSIHFLGLNTARHSPFQYKEYKGTPYFAIEVGSHPSFQPKINAENIKPLATREEVNIHLDYEESSIFAQAKMYLEWITTTPYCRGCGSRTIPVNAGSELLCLSESCQRCPVRSAPVSNASFPRLDPVLITCVMNSSRDKVLLTRLPKFPKGMYTHIAGFIEPGETIEEAVSREVWEESGLTVAHVNIVRSQPWPYPVNIMIGCVATVQDGQMDLGHDMELEEAFWCDLSTLKRIVEEGKEDDNLTVFVPGLQYGIPNDKTLATKLFQYVVDKYS